MFLSLVGRDIDNLTFRKLRTLLAQLTNISSHVIGYKFRGRFKARRHQGLHCLVLIHRFEDPFA